MKNIVFPLHCSPRIMDLAVRVSFLSDSNVTEHVSMSEVGKIVSRATSPPTSSLLFDALKLITICADSDPKVSRHIAAHDVATIEMQHTSLSQQVSSQLAFGIVHAIATFEFYIGVYPLSNVDRKVYVSLDIMPRYEGSVSSLIRTHRLSDLEYTRLFHGYFHDQVVFYDHYKMFHQDCHLGNLLYNISDKKDQNPLPIEVSWSDFGITASSVFKNTTHLYASIDLAFEETERSLGNRTLRFFDELKRLVSFRPNMNESDYMSACLKVMEDKIQSLGVIDRDSFDYAVGGPVAFRLRALSSEVANLKVEVKELRAQISAQNTIIADLVAENKAQNAKIADLVAKNEAQSALIANQSAQIANQSAQIADQSALIANQSALVAAQSAQIADQNIQIASQSAQIAELMLLLKKRIEL